MGTTRPHSQIAWLTVGLTGSPWGLIFICRTERVPQRTSPGDRHSADTIESSESADACLPYLTLSRWLISKGGVYLPEAKRPCTSGLVWRFKNRHLYYQPGNGLDQAVDRVLEPDHEMKPLQDQDCREPSFIPTYWTRFSGQTITDGLIRSFVTGLKRDGVMFDKL